MTYHVDFEKVLKQMDNWIKEPILGKAVIYTGTLENTAGNINLLNYAHLDGVIMG
ncbi:MAG: hypothetical protein SPD54_05155 [Parabacteroides sp.]|nr:hypothetical protein [Parabacteroides sp.]